LVSSSSDPQFPSSGSADMVYYEPSGNYYVGYCIINNSPSPVHVFSLVIRFEEPYDPFGQEGMESYWPWFESAGSDRCHRPSHISSSHAEVIVLSLGCHDAKTL